MRVLVTGGAGFIGSNLVHYLRKHRPDWIITVLDLLTYAGNIENLSSVLDNSEIGFVKADIADETRIDEIFSAKKFDLVLHLAAESHVDRSIHSAGEFVRTNVLGTSVLLSAARKHKVPRFVHISTDEVYGSLGPTGRFVETTPLDPTSPYAASKAASDLLVLAFCKTYGFPGLVTRCTNNYGPYQFPEKFIPLFVTNALESKQLPLYGDGMNVRSWIHVDDHSDALLLVAEKGREGEVYNIGGSEADELPNKVVAEMILSQLKKPTSLIKYVEDRLAHDKRYAIDHGKIKSELGWSPKISFSAGIKSTIDWYVQNELWWRNVKSGEYGQFYEKHYGLRLG